MWKLLLLMPVIVVFASPPCPDGSVYNTEFKSCYKIVNEPEAYLAAKQICANEGGRLALLGNGEENAFVEALVHSSGNTDDIYYWIGQESPLNYSNWASGQNSLNGCAAITPYGGLWAKVDCGFSAPFICQIESTSCPECPTCPALHSYCDSDWTYFQESDSCYKGFFDANWQQASNICVDNGAHLASIHSDDENKFIYNLVTMGTSGQHGDEEMTWFGLHRSPPGSENFVYTDGTTYDPAVFNKWAPGEPSYKDENCVQLTSEERTAEKNGQGFNYTMLWNDVYCNKKHRRFVCKKPAFHG